MQKVFLIGLMLLILISCGNDQSKTFNGYIDTELVYLSADFGGRLIDLPILKGQRVKINQYLFRLEQTTEQYDVEMSKLNHDDLTAQRQQTLAQLHYSDINYHRILGMREHNAASQNDLDMARKDLDVIKQQLAEIEIKIKNSGVEIAQKKWKLSRKESNAPYSGIVFDTYFAKGEYVSVGSPIVSLITQDKLKAIFFVPEERLNRIQLNHKVQLSTDNNPHFAEGHISYISNIAEYTPPIIYSREERQRLVFRVEAKIDNPNLEKIHLGQPVTLEVVK